MILASSVRVRRPAMMLGLAQNLFRLFRENSDVIPLSRLQKQGVRSVTVLDWERIQDLIGRAVDEALARHGVDLSPEALRSVNREAREAFARLVEERDTYRDSARGLERERSELLANLERLRVELERSSGALAAEKATVVTAEDVRVDATGMEEYQRRLRDEVHRLLDGRAPPADLAERVAEVAERLLAEERKRALDGARAEQRRRIEVLERRIAKLRGSLTDTEAMVERLRETGAPDAGIESIYREVQGLAGGDSHAAEKRGLLDEIFKLNVELQDVIRESRSSAGETAGPLP